MADTHLLVNREPELARLDRLVDAAAGGRGQLCFVAGEAGAGKTTLVAEWARGAQERRPDLVVATGTCDAQTGTGDAYLPFRELLAVLTGDANAGKAEGRVTSENARRLRNLLVLTGEVLVELGPDLIGLFVPGASLLAEAGKLLLDKTKWAERLKKRLDRSATEPLPPREGLDQSQIFEQYIGVVRALSEKVILVLALEDLQWADAASLGLLFRLGRRLEGSRLIVLGTFRPNDVALGRDGERHPLEPVVAEMKRYLGDIVLDLDQVQARRGREFVDDFLDTQANCLDGAFRHALYTHTGGHPLFTVELVQHMRDGGYLVPDKDGCWTQGPDLDWTDLPTRIEGVIEERIRRLAEGLRRCLTVASVEGEQFTAEVVARVEALEPRTLVRDLSGGLQREHGLVHSLGMDRVGVQRLSRYRFGHNLVQAYLYGQLDEAEASYLHEDVGAALEALHGDQAAAVAVNLAWHFERAGLSDKAAAYLLQAGRQAAARYANDEALANLGRGLDLAPAADIELSYELLRARERVYDLTGDRPAQKRDLVRLEQLAVQLADPLRRAEVALRRASYALQTGTYAVAATAAQDSAALAVQAGDPLAEARAEHRWGRALWQAGDYGTARPHLDRALDLARAAGSVPDEARCRYDIGVVLHYQDRFEPALESLDAATRLFAALDDRRGEVRCLSLTGIILDRLGRYLEAAPSQERALSLCRELGWRYAESRILVQRANSLLDLGDYEGSRALHENALDLLEQLGDDEARAAGFDALGLIAHQMGELGRAEDLFRQALALHRQVESRRGVGYVLTHLGYLLADLGRPDEAAAALEEAVPLRREMGSYALLLDTLAALALVTLERDRPDSARAYVREILAALDERGTAGVEAPVQVYLSVYRVLSSLAESDPDQRMAAARVLEAGRALLADRADRIQDDTLRARFLSAVPFNRDLLALLAI